MPQAQRLRRSRMRWQDRAQAALKKTAGTCPAVLSPWLGQIQNLTAMPAITEWLVIETGTPPANVPVPVAVNVP